VGGVPRRKSGLRFDACHPAYPLRPSIPILHLACLGLQSAYYSSSDEKEHGSTSFPRWPTRACLLQTEDTGGHGPTIDYGVARIAECARATLQYSSGTISSQSHVHLAEKRRRRHLCPPRWIVIRVSSRRSGSPFSFPFCFCSASALLRFASPPSSVASVVYRSVPLIPASFNEYLSPLSPRYSSGLPEVLSLPVFDIVPERRLAFAFQPPPSPRPG
jgi:hypothetical protein